MQDLIDALQYLMEHGQILDYKIGSDEVSGFIDVEVKMKKPVEYIVFDMKVANEKE